MKLELKQLAPYLPYGLNGHYTLSDVINLSVGQKDEVRNKTLAPECVPFFLSYCKPILRPMSDLNDYYVFTALIGLYTQADIDFIISSPTQLQYNDFLLLLANHFDVFGLIDQGLAIDINTLES